jgi:hypothetical protein
MFNSDILDVAIGMIFVYLILSLICSAAHEMIELWLKKRAIDLERGLRELLVPGSNSGSDDIVKELYNHPLINGLFGGTYEDSGIKGISRYVKRTGLPSYIPARNFALALMDHLLPGTATTASGANDATPPQVNVQLNAPPPPPPSSTVAGTPLAALRSAIATGPVLGAYPVKQKEHLQKALLSVIDAAGNDVSKARENIEAWFNSGMDRVSGWYKRRSQVGIFIIGFAIAVAINADSVLIVKSLATNKALRESLVSAAIDYSKANTSPSPTPKVASLPESGAAKPPVSAAPSSSPPRACVQDPTSPACQFEKNLDIIQNGVQKLGLPLGWVENNPDRSRRWAGLHLHTTAFWMDWGWQFRTHLFGWLLTAFAVSLGAPFWFDLLNKLIVVRSTVKPHEKSREEGSKD